MFGWPFWGSWGRKREATSTNGARSIHPQSSQRPTTRDSVSRTRDRSNGYAGQQPTAAASTNDPGQPRLGLIESALLSLHSERIPVRRLLDPKSPRLTVEERIRISQSLNLYSTVKDQAPTANWEPGRPLDWPSGVDDVQFGRSAFRSEVNSRKRASSNRSLSEAPKTKIPRIDGEAEKPPAVFVPKYNRYFAHPTEDRTDEFFETQFRRLFEKVEEFVKSNYCLFSVTIEKPSDSLWGLPFPPQFVSFAKMVAEPDQNAGGWDGLLANKAQRKWLIIGIIARILETKVFSELLFGGDEHQAKLLQTIESTLVVNEGFSRTELRAKAIRITLGDHAVSPFFYQSVAALSQQIWDLLVQLYMQNDDTNKAYLATTNPTPVNRFPTILQNLQTINDFVADAAYLSICIRLSPEIILFHADQPGNPYESTLHDSIDNVIYKNSKAAAAAAQKSHHTASGLGQPTPAYRAMTQIAVWPRIERYKPGDGTDAGAKDGFRIYKICNAKVVCYWGLEARNRKEKETKDLVEFVAVKRKKLNQMTSRGNWGFFSRTATLGMAATAAVGVLIYNR